MQPVLIFLVVILCLGASAQWASPYGSPYSPYGGYNPYGGNPYGYGGYGYGPSYPPGNGGGLIGAILGK
ncbi:unnamed protein product [Caenorhabditis auriculariae]|uniref:Uncharacterized protein n=1 Tax=Caenorhabditis auriculariae TaxID=2777116 RepID=A0A8S1HPS5_9PELO|nr:unnamed protein product [Caenorhabditis auriculariae]